MQTLFSLDSKFMRAMSRIADLLVLNLVFLITCVPIVTIGAASTAMYTVCFRFGTEREAGVIKSYFRAFRENFRQGTILWLILALCIGTACCNMVIFYRMSGVLHYASVLFLVLAVLAVMITSYVFPLLSQFDNSSRGTLKNALLLSIAYFPRSILMAVLNVFPFGILLVNFYVFLQAGFLWVALYFSAAAYLNAQILKKVFAPYMEKEEPKEETV